VIQQLLIRYLMPCCQRLASQMAAHPSSHNVLGHYGAGRAQGISRQLEGLEPHLNQLLHLSSLNHLISHVYLQHLRHLGSRHSRRSHCDGAARAQGLRDHLDPSCKSFLPMLLYISRLRRLQESVNNEQNQKFSSKGAEIRSYDVSSAAAVSGLHGVVVLISTIGATGLSLQSKLIDAAHGAGVKLLVPAEFGDTNTGRTEPINLLKLAGHKQAAKLGLPTVTVYTGPWMEYIPYFGFDFAAGKITINGSGDAKISTTSMADVAYFVAYALTALPKDKLENATFTLQGDVIVSPPSLHCRVARWLIHAADVQLARRVYPGARVQAGGDHARSAVGVRGEGEGGPERLLLGAVPRVGPGQGPAPEPADARRDPGLGAEEGAGRAQVAHRVVSACIATECECDLN
jgi:hypothetical protein